MRRTGPALIALLAALSIASIFVALAFGSARVPLSEIFALLRGTAEPITHAVVVELRLPRALSAFATGGLLALAGALMQVLLRNPLADPYVLGISGGAAASALGAMLLGLGSLWIDVGAFGGALLASYVVFALARREDGFNPTRLLLTGIVVAAGMSAIISLMLATGDASRLRGMLFWLMGDLSFAGNPAPALVVLVVAAVVGWLYARPLDIMSRGELTAAALGVAVRPLRIGIFVASSLLTAIAVTTAGTIGFVGLVVPHLVRLAAGAGHRVLIPASVLLGGALLVLADTLSRTALAPRQLPVGALTALIGVPFFLLLMRRNRLSSIPGHESS